jgi:hypothetical protein
VAGKRRHSRAPAALDVLAAAPLCSATTLANAVGVSIRAACTMLDAFRAAGLVVEVTSRSSRRPELQKVTVAPVPVGPLPPAIRRDQVVPDYAALQEAMQALDAVARGDSAQPGRDGDAEGLV